MKVHIFVATTQGLVAIQRIYAQDSDIRSVVSINGTATVSPISAAYYHFVKNGVGIIEKDFGGSAYRVNVDGHIDQGNSWQLGFYLAHAANAQNLLGDGNPQHGDSVLCATGEVNTSDRSVLAVEDIPLKLQRAISKIQQWPNGVNCDFLLPKDNYIKLQDTIKLPIQAHGIDSLQDALALLPTKHISPGNQAYRLTTGSGINRWSLLVGVFVLAGILYLGNRPVSLTENTANKAVPEAESHDTLINSNSINELKTLHIEELLDKNIFANATLRLGYADENEKKYQNKCQKSNQDYTELRATKGKFKSTPYPHLCEISFTGAQHYKTVFAIDRVSHRFVRAVVSNGSFNIPVPSQPADYLLLTIKDSIDKAAYRKLHGYLFNLADETTLTAKELAKFIDTLKLEHIIFSHQLTKQ